MTSLLFPEPSKFQSLCTCCTLSHILYPSSFKYPFSFCPPPSPPCPLAVPRDLPRLPIPLSSCRVFSSLLLSASGRLSASASLSLPSLRWPPYWFPASAFPVSAHFPVFPLHFCRLTHSVSLILLQGLWLPTFPGWSRPPSAPPACTPRAGWGGSQVWGL